MTLTLTATARNDVGKGASRRLRRERGEIPAIVYGGKAEPMNITLVHNQVLRASEEDAFFNAPLTLDIDGKTETVTLQAIQRHAYQPKILHLDFKRSENA